MIARITLALLAAAALAGCNQSATTAEADAANAAANQAAEPVVLPPAIVASKVYRCKDNSLVYIDWLADKKTADFRAQQNGPATVLTATEEGGEMVSEGYTLTGDASASTITLTRPDKSAQTCKA